MAIPFLSWRPMKSEADLLVDMLTARLAPANMSFAKVKRGGDARAEGNLSHA
jgi:hypothetical protein